MAGTLGVPGSILGVAARDFLDVTCRVVSHPAVMSTSMVVIVLEPVDPAGSPSRRRS
jgi:hypothetical protein